MRRTALVILIALAALISSAAAQRLTIASNGNPPTLDPHATFNGLTFGITNQVYETLVRLNSDSEVVPHLATAWEYPDANTLRLTLRDGVTFHDGSPLDAAAVVASLERFLDPEATRPGRFVLTAVSEARVVDDLTVDIVTSSPFAPLLAHLAHPVTAIVPTATAADLSRSPVGSGPFQFVSWSDNSEVVLEAYPDYWGGAPAIEEVVVRIIPEVSTQVVELRTGGVDLVFNLPADSLANLQDDDSLSSATFPGWGTHLFGFNSANPKLTDVRVRRALSHAIDKELIAEELLRGLASPAVSPIPPTVAYSVDLPEAYPYDPERARELLAEAGVSDLNLRLDVYQNADLEAIAQVLQFAFSEIGVDLEIRVQPYAAYAEDVVKDDLELFMSGWGTVTLDADYSLYAFFHSGEIPGNNTSRFSDENVDALLEEARANPDSQVRADNYRQVQEIALAADTLDALVYPLSSYVKNPRLQGEVVSFSWIDLNLRDATLSD